MALEDRCEREVRELHVFFEDWFTGRRTDGIGRAEAALGPEFRMVTPDGVVRPREEVLAGIEAGGDAHDEAFGIDVRSVRVCDRTDDRCLVAYEEHQFGAEPSARTSTALFAPDDDAPEGVEWRHLHETWLPDGAPDGADGQG
jgi:hypothetical protein